MKTSLSLLEDLPNEFFHELKSYLSADDLFEAFYSLNSRIDTVLLSLHDLHLEVRSTVDIQRTTTRLFDSRIVSAAVPDDSDATTLSMTFSHLRSITLYRPIRLVASKMLNLKRITLNLSTMRIKNGVSVCQLIFSDHLPSLRSFHLIHQKAHAVGHWRPLINAMRYPSLTLTELLLDIRPTIQCEAFVDILKRVPRLNRLIVGKLNIRHRWTLFDFAKELKSTTPMLNFLSACITCLGCATPVGDNNDTRHIHPLFTRVLRIQKKSRNLTSTTKISSRLAL